MEEPFRWMEAIANRREYLEDQLKSASPVVALSFHGGILLFTVAQDRRKLFEIYDRIGLGSLGHPGDIERLRMIAIDLASTEGFTRSISDVSLQRIGYFALSPSLKAAFEQPYAAPMVARLLFVELGETSGDDLFLAIDFDGSVKGSGRGHRRTAGDAFGVIAGTADQTTRIESVLKAGEGTPETLEEALRVAGKAWLASLENDPTIDSNLEPYPGVVECAVLERGCPGNLTWRALDETFSRSVLSALPSASV